MLMDPNRKGTSLHNSQTGTRDQKLTPRSRTQHPTCSQNRHWAAEDVHVHAFIKKLVLCATIILIRGSNVVCQRLIKRKPCSSLEFRYSVSFLHWMLQSQRTALAGRCPT